MLSRLLVLSVAILPFMARVEGGIATLASLLTVYLIFAATVLASPPGSIVARIPPKGAGLICALILFLLYGNYVSVLNGFGLKDAVVNSLRFGTILVVYLLGIYLSRRGVRFKNRIVWTVAISCLAFAVSGLASAIFNLGDVIGGIERSRGLATTVNNLALYSVVGVFCFIHLWREHSESKFSASAIAMVSSLLCMAGIVAAGSLGVIVAMAAASAVIAMDRKRGKLVGLAAVCGLLAGLMIWDLSTGGSVLFRFSELAAGFSGDADIADPENSLQWRILHWTLLLSRWYAEYFWLGAGTGQHVMLSTLRTMDGLGYSAHNEYLAFLVDFGMVGAGMAVIVLGWYLYNRRRARRQKSQPLAIERAIIVFLAVCAFGTPVLATGAVQYYVPLLLGLFGGSRRASRVERT